MDEVGVRPPMYGDLYRGKKVLVTGHTGFKGTWLATWLLQLGADVYGVSDDVPTIPSMYDKLQIECRIADFREDIRDRQRVQDIVSEVRPDHLFHLAAQSVVSRSYDDPIDTISTNVMGTVNVLEALRASNHTCTGVIVTSDKCYDNVEWVWGYRESDALGGKDIYSGSKGAAEMVIRSYCNSFFKSAGSRVRIASARAGNVIGGGDWAPDRIVPDCIRAWVERQPVEIRNPQATRPWQHVLEPLSGYLALGAELVGNGSLNGESYNFGPSGEDIHTVQALLENLGGSFNDTASFKTYEVVGDKRFGEAGLLRLNCDKALSQLDWRSTLSVGEATQFTSRWYYNFYENDVDMYEFTRSQIHEYQARAQAKKLKWATSG